MNDNLRERIEQAINRGLADWDDAEGDTLTDTERAAQAVIDELGITPTANSRLNQMIQYETKWLPRNKKCTGRRQ